MSHKLFSLAATGLALLATAAFAQTEPIDQVDMQKTRTFSAAKTLQLRLEYLLYLPAGYAKSTNEWPLLVFLHGAGERGTNLAAVKVHGPPKIVARRKDFPFILVSPQCPSGQRWNEDAVLGLINEMIASHRVDTNRVYLTGLSMGGYATWSLGAKHPERFAAIAPICGGGDIVDVLLPARGKGAALKRLPVWAFHGAKDTVVALEESERMVAALKRAGNKTVRLKVYPEADHDSWTETYANEELYEWFLAHSLARE